MEDQDALPVDGFDGLTGEVSDDFDEAVFEDFSEEQTEEITEEIEDDLLDENEISEEEIEETIFEEVTEDALLYADAASGNTFMYIEQDDGTLQILSYTGSSTEVTVPSQIDGKTVSSVPLSTIETTKLPGNKRLFVYCLRGTRSRRAVGILRRKGDVRDMMQRASAASRLIKENWSDEGRMSDL